MIILLKLLRYQLRLEYRLHLKQWHLSINTCLFFLMISTLLPLTLPPSATLLRTIAPGFLWIGLLLALFLSAERLFQTEYEDGIIEQWLINQNPMSLFICTKMIVHWALNILPMLLTLPLFAVIFNLNTHESLIIAGSILAGSPSIMALCTLSAACSASLQQRGVFMALIVFPLTVPVLIFGSATGVAALQSQAISADLALLLAFSCFTVAFLPLVITNIITITLAV